MLYRCTIAFVLVAVVAGACSGSKNEGVSPGTAASATVDTAASTTAGFIAPSAVAAVPATTIPDAATSPVAEAVPGAEVPQSTASPAGTAPETSAPAVAAVPATTVPEVLLRNGVAMVGWDLTVETAEVIDAAVEACSEVFVTSVMSECASALWEACHSGYSSYGRMLRSEGITNFADPELGITNLGAILCNEAYSAETVELAMVLAAKYGDRYYSEDASLPFGEDSEYDLQDFEYDYLRGGVLCLKRA